MEVLAIKTPVVKAGDDFASLIAQAANLRDGDIVVVSSKAVATAEGAAIDLSSVQPTDEAKTLNSMKHKSDAYCQAVLNEMHRMNGWIGGTCPLAILTCLKPDGLPQGVLPIANAGLDVSNIAKGYAIGWPKDPVASVRSIAEGLVRHSGKRTAVILGDSCCMPARIGVVAFALAVCGIDPFVNNVGRSDIFGNAFSMTREASADQLCIAANFVMGNTSECTPAAIVRGHGLTLSDYCGWVPGIEPDEDLFRNMLLRKPKNPKNPRKPR